MSTTDVNRYGNPETLAAAAADFIVAAARESILERKRFTLVLTGGSTPEQMYRMLAGPECASRIDWSRIFVFAGDERFVPETDSRSNFGMARRALLDHVPVPAENLFPIPTSCATPAEGARLYGEFLGRFFNQEPDSVPVPGFDLLLLGLGDDGHVASLFPGMPALDATDSWVTWSPPGTLPPPVDRVTLTMPVINAARSVLFLVSGEKKGAIVHRVLEASPITSTSPRPAFARPRARSTGSSTSRRPASSAPASGRRNPRAVCAGASANQYYPRLGWRGQSGRMQMDVVANRHDSPHASSERKNRAAAPSTAVTGPPLAFRASPLESCSPARSAAGSLRRSDPATRRRPNPRS